MDNWFRWHMHVTSFLPLWISILLIDAYSVVQFICKELPFANDTTAFLRMFAANNWLQLVSIAAVLVVSLWSLASISRFLTFQSGRKNPPKATIRRADRIRTKASEFLPAYILPMIAFDFTTLLGVLLFLIYFAVLAFLCIRNHNVYTNLYLELRRYKMYACDLEYIVADKPVYYPACLVISKEDLTAKIKQEIYYSDFEKSVYIHLAQQPEGEMHNA